MHRRTPSPSLHDEVWETLGTDDPDWAVLTDPARRHGGWDGHLEEFYASGRSEVAAVLDTLPTEAQRERAIDWGSGTGRLTFALLDHFTEVTAVDVSRSMLATLSERASRRGVLQRLTPTLLGDLRPAADHDLALSLLVLQHLGSHAQVTEALQTIVSSLRVGGFLVVEIPSRPVTIKARLQPRFLAYRALRALKVRPTVLHRNGLSGISMRCLSPERVRGALRESGAEVVGAPTGRSDGAHQYVRYVAQRVR
jgi:SAM-dependent methyltransferase